MRSTINWILVIVAALLAGIALWQGGAGLALEGLAAGGRTLVSVIPLLLAAFLIAGLIQTMVTEEMVTRWLGSAAGWRGILLGCLGGLLMPGGPYVYYPIAAALLTSGASLGVLVAFVTAKKLWSVTRLPLEFGILGPRLTAIRIIFTLIFPPLFGFVAEKAFGSAVMRMREEAQA